MKATLEFDMHDPDDAKTHMLCARATDIALALDDVYQYLRSHAKHGDGREAAIAESYRARAAEIIEERDLVGLMNDL